MSKPHKSAQSNDQPANSFAPPLKESDAKSNLLTPLHLKSTFHRPVQSSSDRSHQRPVAATIPAAAADRLRTEAVTLQGRRIKIVSSW